MFEHFTDRARKVMALANQEAHRCKNEYIGTEHLLMALVNDGQGAGMAILRTLSIDIDKLRAELAESVRWGPDVDMAPKLQPTPKTKKVIALAIDEAKAVKHRTIGTEHILAGLLRERETIAAQVLSKLGLTPEAIRTEIIRLPNARYRTVPRRIGSWVREIWRRPTQQRMASQPSSRES